MKSIIRRISIVTALTVLLCSIATPQDQLLLKGKSETTIDLSYYKKADMSRTVVAAVHAKNSEGKFVPAKNARVNFYVMNGKEQLLLESMNSDNKGLSVIMLQKDLPLDENNFFTVVAKVENDSLYEDTEEKIHYTDANLVLDLNPQDTARIVTAKVMESGKGRNEIPVQNIVVKFYVQRLFGIMPVSEDNAITTNEKGEASFAFPKNIRGDTEGVINLVVRIEDDEKLGNVENKATESWGISLAVNKNPFPRALWEPNAPLPLIITVSTLFLLVWLFYFFIFYQLRKIRKE
jgi:hypothetical protein